MRLLRQGFQIAYAIVACPGLEEVAKGECTEGRVATCASPSDGEPIGIYPALNKVTCAIYAIVNVYDTPPTI